ncbi:hypothetical protein DB347_09555 [Opitutaceae bacterium EW11]|nr:hypothetical protein DB347_09555 [Opitutaceae bacterium EW11]
MRTVFTIEDEWHAELQGEFATRALAMDELRRRTTIPWDREPNLAPCTGWRTCGRQYHVLEYEAGADGALVLVRREPMLEVSAAGVRWLSETA